MARQGTWMPASMGMLPRHDAVVGGSDGAEPLYVARARHNGALVPGKVHGAHKTCYVGMDNKEFAYQHYEVLVGSASFKWHPTSGSIPLNAVQGGHNSEGVELFVARAKHNGHFVPGKCNRKTNVCWLPFGGHEHKYPAFEVLVWK